MRDPDWLRKVDNQPQQGTSQVSVNPDDVDRISCSVRGKTVFRQKLTGEETLRELEPVIMEHGRKAVITFKMKDGSKFRMRGNGSVLLDPNQKPTAFGSRLLRENRERQRYLEKRRKERDSENAFDEALALTENLHQEIGIPENLTNKKVLEE